MMHDMMGKNPPNGLGFEINPKVKSQINKAHKHQDSLIRVLWCTPSNQGLKTKHEDSQTDSQYMDPWLGFRRPTQGSKSIHKAP